MYACEIGCLKTVKYLVKNYKISWKIFGKAFQKACGNGKLDIAIWFYKNFKNISICFDIDIAFIDACKGRHLETEKWIKRNLCISHKYCGFFGHVNIKK
jgi:hypothetical protein